MTDQQLLQLAIAESKKSTEPLPCGVVITKDGQTITASFNQQHSSHNATAHAEILAIGQAGKLLGNKNLHDCTIFCSCEPCPMCLSAIVFAKIGRLVYFQKLSDISPKNKLIDISMEEFLNKSPNKPQVIQLNPEP